MKRLVALLCIIVVCFGCTNPPRPESARGVCVAVRVPARIGQVVSVSVDEITETGHPFWSETMSGWFGDMSCCELAVVALENGPEWGSPPVVRELPMERRYGQIRFVVDMENRHSPWVVYWIMFRGLRRADLPDAAAPAIPQGDVARGLPVLSAAHAWAPRQSSSRSFKRYKDYDYLVVAPEAYLETLEPLVEYREKQGFKVLAVSVEDVYACMNHGNVSPEAIHEYVDLLRDEEHGGLRYVLLVGDCQENYSPDAGAPTPVATYYKPKMHYKGFWSGGGEYATDEPYAERFRPNPADGSVAADTDVQQRLFVGRLPVRSVEELQGVVRKIVDYETAPADDGEWQRRLLFFGGPAEYSPVLDAVIEGFAAALLEQLVPYDFSPRVMFAKTGSPYAYRFDRLGEKIVEELNGSALLATYAGHGSPGAFDTVRVNGRRYSIGSREDLSRVSISNGKPLFICLTCHTGAYDRARGERSLAEELFLNPGGPIAVFASSRVSHPYPNALYGREAVTQLLQKRPETVGEGIMALKDAMEAGDVPMARMFVKDDMAALKAEHRGLYNLLGDPATRLRYPKPLGVAVSASVVGTDPKTWRVEVRVDECPVKSGAAIVTFEAPRTAFVRPFTTVTNAMSREERFEAIAANHEKAQDRVLRRVEANISGGSFKTSFEVDRFLAGSVVKVLVPGHDAAVGHVRFETVPD